MASSFLSMFPRQVAIARFPWKPCLRFGSPHHLLCLPRQYPRSAGTKLHERRLLLAFKVAGVAGVGLGVSLFVNWKPIQCEPSGQTTSSPKVPSKGSQQSSDLPPLPNHPPSSIDVYGLSFGTVCGICAGVFVKKGAKALAFAFGGVFVLLQYLGSLSVIKVDWGSMSTRFENLFYRAEGSGGRRPPTVLSLWRWMVDFLTADFQQRASFLAGLALGIRLG